ncbi:epithelial cell transforming sequence 2 oncoprotein-like [Balamuthia mandrillaris]
MSLSIAVVRLRLFFPLCLPLLLVLAVAVLCSLPRVEGKHKDSSSSSFATAISSLFQSLATMALCLLVGYLFLERRSLLQQLATASALAQRAQTEERTTITRAAAGEKRTEVAPTAAAETHTSGEPSLDQQGVEGKQSHEGDHPTSNETTSDIKTSSSSSSIPSPSSPSSSSSSSSSSSLDEAMRAAVALSDSHRLRMSGKLKTKRKNKEKETKEAGEKHKKQTLKKEDDRKEAGSKKKQEKDSDKELPIEESQWQRLLRIEKELAAMRLEREEMGRKMENAMAESQQLNQQLKEETERREQAEREVEQRKSKAKEEKEHETEMNLLKNEKESLQVEMCKVKERYDELLQKHASTINRYEEERDCWKKDQAELEYKIAQLEQEITEWKESFERKIEQERNILEQSANEEKTRMRKLLEALSKEMEDMKETKQEMEERIGVFIKERDEALTGKEAMIIVQRSKGETEESDDDKIENMKKLEKELLEARNTIEHLREEKIANEQLLKEEIEKKDNTVAQVVSLQQELERLQQLLQERAAEKQSVAVLETEELVKQLRKEIETLREEYQKLEQQISSLSSSSQAETEAKKEEEKPEMVALVKDLRHRLLEAEEAKAELEKQLVVLRKGEDQKFLAVEKILELNQEQNLMLKQQLKETESAALEVSLSGDKIKTKEAARKKKERRNSFTSPLVNIGSTFFTSSASAVPTTSSSNTTASTSYSTSASSSAIPSHTSKLLSVKYMKRTTSERFPLKKKKQSQKEKKRRRGATAATSATSSSEEESVTSESTHHHLSLPKSASLKQHTLRLSLPEEQVTEFNGKKGASSNGPPPPSLHLLGANRHTFDSLREHLQREEEEEEEHEDEKEEEGGENGTDALFSKMMKELKFSPQQQEQMSALPSTHKLLLINQWVIEKQQQQQLQESASEPHQQDHNHREGVPALRLSDMKIEKVKRKSGSLSPRSAASVSSGSLTDRPGSGEKEQNHMTKTMKSLISPRATLRGFRERTQVKSLLGVKDDEDQPFPEASVQVISSRSAPQLEVTKEDNPRHSILKELVHTEKTFVSSLQTIVNVFVKPISFTANTSHAVLTPEELVELFPESETLLELHEKLLQHLEKVVKKTIEQESKAITSKTVANTEGTQDDKSNGNAGEEVKAEESKPTEQPMVDKQEEEEEKSEQKRAGTRKDESIPSNGATSNKKKKRASRKISLSEPAVLVEGAPIEVSEAANTKTADDEKEGNGDDVTEKRRRRSLEKKESAKARPRSRTRSRSKSREREGGGSVILPRKTTNSKRGAREKEFTAVADVFLGMADSLRLPYTRFVNAYTAALVMLEKKLAENGSFAEFMNSEKVTQAMGVADLSSLLITPVQRLPRYRLLLEELVKRTGEHHPEHAMLKEALAKISKIAISVEEMAQKCEDAKAALLRIKNASHLIEPNRKLIKGGTCAHSKKHLYLFDDILVIAKPPSSIHISKITKSSTADLLLKNVFPIVHVELSALDEENNNSNKDDKEKERHGFKITFQVSSATFSDVGTRPSEDGTNEDANNLSSSGNERKKHRKHTKDANNNNGPTTVVFYCESSEASAEWQQLITTTKSRERKRTALLSSSSASFSLPPSSSPSASNKPRVGSFSN